MTPPITRFRPDHHPEVLIECPAAATQRCRVIAIHTHHTSYAGPQHEQWTRTTYPRTVTAERARIVQATSGSGRRSADDVAEQVATRVEDTGRGVTEGRPAPRGVRRPGRRPKVPPAQERDVVACTTQGIRTVEELAQDYGVGTSNVYRVLARADEQQTTPDRSGVDSTAAVLRQLDTGGTDARRH